MYINTQINNDLIIPILSVCFNKIRNDLKILSRHVRCNSYLSNYIKLL